MVCDERSPFAGMMMIDSIRSQLFRWSLHASRSLTSGISKMNGLPLSRTGEVIFSCAHVKAIVEKKKNMTRRKHSFIVTAGNGRDNYEAVWRLCFEIRHLIVGITAYYLPTNNLFYIIFLKVFNCQYLVAMY